MLIKVRDFGTGIAPDQAKILRAGVGVSGMKERITQLGGELHLVRSEPWLLVEASIPLFE
jgi:signal transduction histidine kinase